ncbi:type II toxin-antitoxin system VapC family toxin [soil metagenome]
MAFVLDASVTIAWAFGDELSITAHPVLRKIQAAFAIVPALWQFETASALRKAHADGRLSRQLVDGFIVDLSTLDIRLESQVPSIAKLLGLAIDSGLSTYDAAYLELFASPRNA